MSEATSASSQSKFSYVTDVPIVEIYFRHYVELSALAQEVQSDLYRPGIRRQNWSHIRDIMEEFDRRLCRWETKLAPPFNRQPGVGSAETECYRGSLVILYHTIRMIINRPSLCRIERKRPTKESGGLSNPPKRSTRGTSEKCVASARAIVSIITSRPSNVVLTRSATWWMLLNHLQRALTVLLLELALRSEHMPSEAEEILLDAKKAVNWLRISGENSDSTRQTWQTMSRLLARAAQRVGLSTSDTAISLSEPPRHSASQSMQLDNIGRRSMSSRGYSNQLVRRAPDYQLPSLPNMMPLSNEQSGMDLDILAGPPYFSHLDTFDQFNYIPGASQGELFPSAGQMGQLALDTQHGGQRQTREEDEEEMNYRMGDWLDFEGGQGR